MDYFTEVETIKKIINMVQKAGISRPLDELGRVVIPIDFRRFGFEEGTWVCVNYYKNSVLITRADEGDTGQLKKIDSLGRVVADKIFRDEHNWQEKDKIVVFYYKGIIVMQKLQEKCVICENTKNLIQYQDKKICTKCEMEIFYKVSERINIKNEEKIRSTTCCG